MDQIGVVGGEEAVSFQAPDLVAAQPATIGPQPPLDVVQMVPPDGAIARTGLSTELWDSMGAMSGKMRALFDEAHVFASTPAKPPELTGNLFEDTARIMGESQSHQARLMEMQLKITEVTSTFSVGLGMVQSSQHATQTLFQEK